MIGSASWNSNREKPPLRSARTSQHPCNVLPTGTLRLWTLLPRSGEASGRLDRICNRPERPVDYYETGERSVRAGTAGQSHELVERAPALAASRMSSTRTNESARSIVGSDLRHAARLLSPSRYAIDFRDPIEKPTSIDAPKRQQGRQSPARLILRRRSNQ